MQHALDLLARAQKNRNKPFPDLDSIPVREAPQELVQVEKMQESLTKLQLSMAQQQQSLLKSQLKALQEQTFDQLKHFSELQSFQTDTQVKQIKQLSSFYSRHIPDMIREIQDLAKNSSQAIDNHQRDKEPSLNEDRPMIHSGETQSLEVGLNAQNIALPVRDNPNFNYKNLPQADQSKKENAIEKEKDSDISNLRTDLQQVRTLIEQLQSEKRDNPFSVLNDSPLDAFLKPETQSVRLPRRMTDYAPVRHKLVEIKSKQLELENPIAFQPFEFDDIIPVDSNTLSDIVKPENTKKSVSDSIRVIETDLKEKPRKTVTTVIPKSNPKTIVEHAKPTLAHAILRQQSAKKPVKKEKPVAEKEKSVKAFIERSKLWQPISQAIRNPILSSKDVDPLFLRKSKQRPTSLAFLIDSIPTISQPVQAAIDFKPIGTQTDTFNDNYKPRASSIATSPTVKQQDMRKAQQDGMEQRLSQWLQKEVMNKLAQTSQSQLTQVIQMKPDINSTDFSTQTANQKDAQVQVEEATVLKDAVTSTLQDVGTNTDLIIDNGPEYSIVNSQIWLEGNEPSWMDVNHSIKKPISPVANEKYVVSPGQTVSISNIQEIQHESPSLLAILDEKHSVINTTKMLEECPSFSNESKSESVSILQNEDKNMVKPKVTFFKDAQTEDLSFSNTKASLPDHMSDEISFSNNHPDLTENLDESIIQPNSSKETDSAENQKLESELQDYSETLDSSGQIHPSLISQGQVVTGSSSSSGLLSLNISISETD